ncbi:MAG: hypothetical protein IJ944_05915 [Clostridia bacterium]|nr:hypothetical protein [Clostridia bacterium]
MKKLLAIAMCLALMVTSFVTASADVDATITIATVEGPIAAGEEVALSVNITEWANAYATIEFTLEYDEALLELDAVEASEDDFGGAMAAYNDGKFALVCNPTSDRQAKKLLGGEVCVIYFYAATDINESTVVEFAEISVKGYAQGKTDNWTETQYIDLEEVNGGVHVDIDEHECTPAGDIQHDETDHWYNCASVGCGNLVNKAPHEGGEATCTAKANCSVCGAEYGAIDATNHAGETEVRDAVTADCGNDGYTGDTYCEDCGVKIANGTAIHATGAQTGGTATCIQMAECAVCGMQYGEADANNHSDYETEVRGATDSYTGDTYCLACDKMIAQGQAIDPTTGSAIVSNATAKSGDEFTVTVSMGANTKLAAYGATLVFDESKLELVTMTPGTFCAAVNPATKKATGFGFADVTSGTFFTATFKAINDFYGETQVTVEFDANATSNAAQNKITMITTPGVITIECAHKGGEATCKDKAVCEICGESYGDLNAENHKGETEVRDAVPASCYENGYTGDTYCKDCDAKIADGRVIPATEQHIPEADLDYDETDHWYNCETIGCGNQISKAPHEGGEATCNAKAECTVCGAEYGEFAADNHKGETEVRDAKTNDCRNDGYTGDTYCKDCGVMIEEGEVIPATGAHTGGEATCNAKAECDVCGQEYGDVDADNHVGETEVRDAKEANCMEEGYTGDTYCLDCDGLLEEGEVIPVNAQNHKGPANDEYGYDAENHWFTCECGAEVDKEAHKGGEATCQDKAKCDVCGQKYGEIDPEGHFGGEATCIEKALCDGCGAEYGELNLNNHKNTEKRGNDTYCKDCDKLVEKGEIEKEEETTKPTTPPTGDASNVAVAGALCLAAVAAAFVLNKKRG